MKDKLQQAALALLTQKGLKFTMGELASYLGISKRTIYEHFASKEEIISSIVDDAIDEVLQTQRRIYENEDWSIIRKIKAILSIVPSGLRLVDARLLEEMKRYAPQEWSKIDSLLQEEWGTVETLLQQGIENGEIRPIHVPTVIECMRGASFAIYNPDFLMNTTVSLMSAIDSMVDMLMNGIVSPANEDEVGSNPPGKELIE
ncbi:TetR/AcrR family transcriptional regulator [Paenibacillus sp.]|jgi:AcrR family transcriptional regulator|uniref:TetR/AcrR family transcriptional regulator n=1 Tax=Paenibacillus sp. TaxID=58172 RepID=UPI0028201EAA|nr:TetR/AcrR family transcriptional regulator [Paenibacillus sp.]MDR0270928.1 TetR/AcrR family transcriptional regulator [Paenibacillus sp.]